MTNINEKLESLRITAEHISTDVHKALDLDLKNEKRKTLVFGIVIVGMIIYMTFMIGQIKQINAEFIVGYGTRLVIDNTEDFGSRAGKQLRTKIIPELFADLGSGLETQLREQFDQQLVSMQTVISERSSEELTQLRADVMEHHPNAKDMEAAEIVVNELANNYREAVLSAHAAKEASINEGIQEIEDYLTVLASEENLSERQTMEKEFIEAVIALMHHYSADGFKWWEFKDLNFQSK